MGETRYLVPGLVRGLEVLQAFTPAAPALTLAQMAAAAGVTRSAVFRIACTLTELGFLVHDAAARRYTLGPALLRLGAGLPAPRALVSAALPVLEALRDRTGWSAHLGVLEGREVVYLLRVPARRGIASIVHAGSRLPAHATAMGRVLLAALAAPALAALYRDTGMALPPLLARLARDAKRGHVLHLGEFESSIASIAVPVRDAAGRVAAAINAAAPLSAADAARQPALLAALRDAAAAMALPAADGHGRPARAALSA